MKSKICTKCRFCKGAGGYYYKKRVGHDRGDYVWQRCTNCGGSGKEEI